MFNELFSFIFFFMSLPELALPQPTQEQKDLIQQMTAPEYIVREKATIDLSKMGRSALFAVEKYGLQNKDLEIRRRSNLVIRRMYADLWPKEPERGWPYIYSLFRLGEVKLPSGHSVVFSNATGKYYFSIAGGVNGEWNESAFANGTRLMVRDLIRTGWTKEDLEFLLNQMRESQD